jgi:glycosyltransferase involved in cell wall biosynthesis
MRILHVGFGFRPWIVNGLVIYTEALMDGQVRQGHDVGYFFSGRQLPVVRRPFLHQWTRGGVRMFELVNSSLIVGRHRGTAEPEQDLHHAPSESAFCRVLRCFAPELIHVHDLGGLPSSILGLGDRHGVPTVMTIHDYHALCPTVKLYDAHDRVCLRPDPGAMCAVCCSDAPVDNREELTRTLLYAANRLRSILPPLDAAVRRVRSHTRKSSAAPRPTELRQPPRAPGLAYQHRRDLNVERLSRLDALVASSERSAEVYRRLGVAGEQIRVVPVSPPHIERLRPKRRRTPGEPLRFVALNACSSTQKGADLIVQALARLSQRGLDSRYRLAVYGPVTAHVLQALAAHPSVVLHGPYATGDLDELLEDGDVGLFPSVWEEVYGFVGLEFLAKGIPVIGSATGAIPEYVRPGQTGWLNRSRSADELAGLMTRAIEDPSEVERLAATAVQLRDELIRPFTSGLAELSSLYDELVGRVAEGRLGR